MSSSDNEDRRMEAAALHVLQEARIGIVFSIPKEKKRKDDVVQGRYFSWIASQPPAFHMSRPLADIVADKDLTVQVDLDGLSLTIPRLVYEICTFLKRSRQLGTEGLFRKSGNASRVRMLQQHLDAYGRLPAKDIKQHKYTCHDMVQVLKAFLRHLPGGIINFLYKPFVVAQRVKHEEDPVTQRTPEEATEFGLNMTMCLCYLLPAPHQHLLQYMMHFFVDHFGPAQEQQQERNTMTLDNLAKILGPSILPTNTTSRPGMEDNSEYVIAAVRDMMLGYRRGLLFTSYLKAVCERATRISPREAQRIYKAGFLDKMTKPKRRSRASGLGDAIRSAGGEVMKQLQRKGSSKSNISDKSTSRPSSANTTPKARRRGRRSLGDPATMTSSTSTSSHTAWSSSSSSSSSSGARQRSQSLKRRSGSVHTDNGEDHARQRCKFGDDPAPKRAPVSTTQRPGRIISATEAKRKGLEMAPVLDPRQQATAGLGKENTGSNTACVSTTDERAGIARRKARAGTPRTRRRSFEGVRRLSGGLSGSAKKVKNFMRRRSSRSSSEPRKTKQEDETAATTAHEPDETSAHTAQDDNFLDLLPKTDHNDSDVITLEELSLFSQMCYEAQQKYESTKTPAATTEPGVVDPRSTTSAFSTAAHTTPSTTLSSSSSSLSSATIDGVASSKCVTKNLCLESKKPACPQVPVAGAQELRRPPRKTRVGQPPVIRHPAGGYGVGRMGRTGDTPTRALLQSPGYSNKRFGIRAPPRRGGTAPAGSSQQHTKNKGAHEHVLQESFLSVEKPSFQRGKQGSGSGKSGSTKSQRTALGNIDNTAKSPNARSKMNTPLLQKEDRFTFV